MVTLMLVERDLPKGVDNLIEIFALETNKQTNKNKTQTKKDNKTLIRRNENTEMTSQSKLDPFSCIVVHEPEKRPTSFLWKGTTSKGKIQGQKLFRPSKQGGSQSLFKQKNLGGRVSGTLSELETVFTRYPVGAR